jgi:UDP-N-acetylmuramate dehydrogenase
MLNIQENICSKNFSTFRIGGFFRYFVEIKNEKDLFDLFNTIKLNDNYNSLPILFLGEGSNTIFSDQVLNFIVIKINIKKFEIVNEDSNSVYIKVGAGMLWDNFVKKSINNNFSGIEALSIIPGTVGATPVQNVGAYGIEVKDIIKEVVVYDNKEEIIKNLSNKDCQFGYRDSLFKKEKGRYIILYVIYKLSKNHPSIPNYPDIVDYFKNKNILNPTIKDIRKAIIFIRNNKLPDFRSIPNVGSFFKNPIITNNIAYKLKEKFPDIKLFKIDDSYMKISAGWLIENTGIKGKNFGNISVYNKNALVLVNNGNATFIDLMNAKDKIIKIVEDKFGITLEQEPEII